jgi:outer membrane protein
VIEAGVEIMVSERWGFFVEAKRAFLNTEARGSFAGMPVVGQVGLGPWGGSAGISLRF